MQHWGIAFLISILYAIHFPTAGKMSNSKNYINVLKYSISKDCLYNLIGSSNSNLQPKFSQVLNRGHSLHLSSVSSLSEEVRRALESVVSIVDNDQIFTDFSPAHMQASARIMDILRGEEKKNTIYL
jgi:hypothetical protein